MFALIVCVRLRTIRYLSLLVLYANTLRVRISVCRLGTVINGNEPSQVEHVVLKKKPKCRCCAVQ